MVSETASSSASRRAFEPLTFTNTDPTPPAPPGTRRVQRLGRGIGRPVIAAGAPEADRCGTTTAQDGADVGEVEIDASGSRDEVDDLGNAPMHRLVDRPERGVDRDVGGHQLADLVVWHRGDGIDDAGHGGGRVLRDVGLPHAFEAERHRDHGERQRALPPSDLRDDGRRAGSGPSPRPATMTTRSDPSMALAIASAASRAADSASRTMPPAPSP